MLATGTVNWELQHISRQQLDLQNGFKLEITPVASLAAASLALTSGSADTIVSDWLWASERHAQGSGMRFLPFSSQIGDLVKAKGSNITSIRDLRGKRIGVAGGPMNKGWVLLQAAASKQGINLRQEAEIQFGAPPLLSQSLKKGRVDLLVTFWHYGARLQAEGYEVLISLEQLMQSLGLKSQVPMLGYLFPATYAEQHPELIAAFSRAVTGAKQQLNADMRYWQTLRPLMKAGSESIFQALVSGYRQGIPAPISADQIADAARFYRIIDQLRQQPRGDQLAPELFLVLQP
ncbi:ABC transporter substrate-binding protein [Neptuniibacter halophilus]|uniref:ABC transporter substrate-binding protein n=1 Tax=Neptuniibacter halophilus TaxID=651666 RepID=UPI0025746849|nr:ABC transporter substrate-binding protein [Neptuniibacter halophilus]